MGWTSRNVVARREFSRSRISGWAVYPGKLVLAVSSIERQLEVRYGHKLLASSSGCRVGVDQSSTTIDVNLQRSECCDAGEKFSACAYIRIQGLRRSL